MAPLRIAVAGAGGFAREIRWLIGDLADSGTQLTFVGYVVSDLSRLSDADDTSAVIGQIDQISPDAPPFDAIAIGIGTPEPRSRVSSEVLARWPGVEVPPLVHPSAILNRSSAQIHRGAIVAAGVVGTVNLVIDEFAMVNINSTLGHESVVGRWSVINPLVAVSGGVTIGDGVLVGTGASILQNLSIGEGATVGAGAVVTRSVPAGVTVVGVPAAALSPI